MSDRSKSSQTKAAPLQNFCFYAKAKVNLVGAGRELIGFLSDLRSTVISCRYRRRRGAFLCFSRNSTVQGVQYRSQSIQLHLLLIASPRSFSLTMSIIELGESIPPITAHVSSLSLCLYLHSYFIHLNPPPPRYFMSQQVTN